MTLPISELLATARARLVRPDPAAAAAAQAAGALLVDIRPVEVRRRYGELPGALIVDRNVLEWRLDPGSAHRLPEVTRYDQHIILVCSEGYASSLAAATLQDLGLFNATDLAGGFVAWAEAGLPVRSAASGTGALKVEPLTGTLGAVVHGVDLAVDLDEDAVAELHRALLSYRVLFFRDQQLTPSRQVAFGRRFGELTPAHPLVGGLDADHPEVLVLDSRRYALGVGSRGQGTSYNNRWHTDVTFSERPPLGSILAAKVVPDRGGDTLWADLADAYATLSPSLRSRLESLRAVHDAAATFEAFRADDPHGAHQKMLADLEPVSHPVVRIHPETGDGVLFVNPVFTRHIEGLPAAESRALLELLYDHIAQPERTVRWRWRAGDVAFWDNRATAHYAVADYGDAPRVMHRITIAGECPFGPEGAERHEE